MLYLLEKKGEGKAITSCIYLMEDQKLRTKKGTTWFSFPHFWFFPKVGGRCEEVKNC